MATPIQIDPAAGATNGILDSLFGTANQALGVWSEWQNAKLDLTAKKAAIPATVAQPTPAIEKTYGGLSGKVWGIIGAAVAVLLVVVLVVRRK